MSWQPATRLQVSGYRFLRRRTEDALLGVDLEVVRPARAQALAAGCLVTALVAVGCAMLALVRPQPGLAGVPIVMGARSGALYVRVGDLLHPVLNLASARLIAQTDAAPRPVDEDEIGRARRGPLLGIPGAPGFLGPPLTAEESVWTLCDSGSPAETTVLIGPIDPPSGSPGGPHTVLVTADSGATTYLLYNGRRALVGIADPAMRRASHGESRQPQHVSRLLLDAIPEGPPIAASTAVSLPDESWDYPAAGVLCATWVPRSPGRPEVALLAGAQLPLPVGQTTVGLAQADGDGPLLDAVSLPPGRTVYARAAEASYLIADTGVRFAVRGDDAARGLGLPNPASPAPWPMLGALPQGPELSRDSALVARDILGPATGRPTQPGAG